MKGGQLAESKQREQCSELCSCESAGWPASRAQQTCLDEHERACLRQIGCRGPPKTAQPASAPIKGGHSTFCLLFESCVVFSSLSSLTHRHKEKHSLLHSCLSLSSFLSSLRIAPLALYSFVCYRHHIPLPTGPISHTHIFSSTKGTSALRGSTKSASTSVSTMDKDSFEAAMRIIRLALQDRINHTAQTALANGKALCTDILL